MSNCVENCVKCFLYISYNFPKQLIKTGFLANDKWRQAPVFDLLHQKCEI